MFWTFRLQKEILLIMEEIGAFLVAKENNQSVVILGQEINPRNISFDSNRDLNE